MQRCGAKSTRGWLISGVVAVAINAAGLCPGHALAADIEQNTLACPAHLESGKFDVRQLEVSKPGQLERSEMYAKVTGQTKDENDSVIGFTADVLLPTITVRGLVFNKSSDDPYDAREVYRFSACGGVFVISAMMGHPYFANYVSVQVLTGAAGSL